MADFCRSHLGIPQVSLLLFKPGALSIAPSLPDYALATGRMWNCFDNYYVKTFARWRGSAMCDPLKHDGCVGGVGRAQLEAAKETLDKIFDAVLITEWLSSRPQVLHERKFNPSSFPMSVFKNNPRNTFNF